MNRKSINPSSIPTAFIGLLGKKGNKGTWNTRYCVLRDTTLYCYIDKQDTIPEENINVLISQVQESKMPPSKDKKKFYFDIITPYKTHNMYAHSKPDMDAWVECIQKVAMQYSGVNAGDAYQPPTIEEVTKQPSQVIYLYIDLSLS